MVHSFQEWPHQYGADDPFAVFLCGLNVSLNSRELEESALIDGASYRIFFRMF